MPISPRCERRSSWSEVQRRKAAAEIVDCGAGVLGDLELPLVHGLDRLSAGNYATVLLVEVREPIERELITSWLICSPTSRA